MISVPTLKAMGESVKKEEERKKGELLPLMDKFEKSFQLYTLGEAHQKLEDVRKSLKGFLAKLFAPGRLRKGEMLVAELDSISVDPKTVDELEQLIVEKEFPDEIVEEYSKKLKDEHKVLKTLKEQYAGGGGKSKGASNGELKKREELKRQYFGQLKSISYDPTEEQVAGMILSDISRDLSQGGQLCFPMLDFYVVLLKKYEQAHPSKGGEPSLVDLFMKRLHQFLSTSINLARSSDTFEDFDAKMRDLKSFEPPLVKRGALGS
ncbi:MAG: hypothetical protein ABIF01_04090 [Candidatus Micrarchaeota archaeon]